MTVQEILNEFEGMDRSQRKSIMLPLIQEMSVVGNVVISMYLGSMNGPHGKEYDDGLYKCVKEAIELELSTAGKDMRRIKKLKPFTLETII